MSVSFSFGHVAVTGVYPSAAHQLLLGVEADFRVTVGLLEVMHEPHFPIVELRQWLRLWLSAGASDDFVYTSIEAEDEGLLTFQRAGGSRWIVDSAWSTLIRPPVVDLSCLVLACERFVDDVDYWVASELGVDVSQVVGDLR